MILNFKKNPFVVVTLQVVMFALYTFMFFSLFGTVEVFLIPIGFLLYVTCGLLLNYLVFNKMFVNCFGSDSAGFVL